MHGRTVRHLSEVVILRRGALVEIRVTGDAFLRRMVRSIASSHAGPGSFSVTSLVGATAHTVRS